MKKIVNAFRVSYEYPVYFTERVFRKKSPLLKDLFSGFNRSSGGKILFVLDNGLLAEHASLPIDIKAAFSEIPGISLCDEVVVVPGGEHVKNRPHLLQEVLEAIERNGLCRHSFLAAVGGGAVLDMAGFAASISHRGIRHLRFPTTVLSQNDSGVGVKNGINAFGKKNFIGAFSPPYAVINDSSFLKTLSARDWRSGISEAVKVALIKDKHFFDWIETSKDLFAERDPEIMNELIYRCASLHMRHIASRDPFEKGSSRPLDFGHWSAHKLEQLTKNKIKHGEAVAIGIAIDSTLSFLSELLTEKEWVRILELIRSLGFQLYAPELSAINNGKPELLKGLEEFREHLGGELTITLLKGIGIPIETSSINPEYLIRSIEILRELETAKHIGEFLKKKFM